MYNKFISFWKDHQLYDEEMFQYFQENSSFFDYRETEYRSLIGCFYVFKNQVLKKIVLNVPYIDDEATILINIHEYTHAILFYQKIGKKCKIEADKECLPMLYERIYLMEHPSKEGESFEQKLNDSITDNTDTEYTIALSLQEELLKLYYQGYNLEKLERKTKKLVKKLHKTNKTRL